MSKMELNNSLELNAIIRDAVTSAVQRRKIYGIKGLCEFLQCSPPTAIKISKSGKFNRYENGRVIFFYEDEVLNGLNRKNNG